MSILSITCFKFLNNQRLIGVAPAAFEWLLGVDWGTCHSFEADYIRIWCATPFWIPLGKNRYKEYHNLISLDVVNENGYCVNFIFLF
jgi:hypothetical protein